VRKEAESARRGHAGVDGKSPAPEAGIDGGVELENFLGKKNATPSIDEKGGRVQAGGSGECQGELSGCRFRGKEQSPIATKRPF